MKQFTDTKGTTWDIEANVTTLRNVRDLLGVDLINLSDNSNVLARLADDEILMTDVVFVLCKDQAAGLGVTDEDFGRRMAGDCLDDAYQTILDELASFSRSPARRRAIKKIKGAVNIGEIAAMKMLDDPALDKAISEAVTAAVQMAGRSLTNLPESSALTPDP